MMRLNPSRSATNIAKPVTRCWPSLFCMVVGRSGSVISIAVEWRSDAHRSRDSKEFPGCTPFQRWQRSIRVDDASGCPSRVSASVRRTSKIWLTAHRSIPTHGLPDLLRRRYVDSSPTGGRRHLQESLAPFDQHGARRVARVLLQYGEAPSKFPAAYAVNAVS